ncbi:MAG: TIGR02186 family protein [Alphaproteobacteria bacterium]|nr:TIGR02186 family protein [Alphaproteobacteria bacterium]MBU0796212.1 TIGR02186 family protein [Alphaproteobacteria bacterium]MBU0888440.1 TIGR02186 family protein [Alphaproteobacteria bacterium]MBU1813097.1 TIGR02186 family protein [Alphaproteobacteria bacterium]
MTRTSAPSGFLALLFLALLVLPERARAQDLVADLSEHLVAITAGFTGTDVLLFGAIEGPGDVVVVVTGPAHDVIVRRKDKLLGIWLNAKSIRFSGAPSYYAVASSRPPGTFLSDAILGRLEVGANNLRLIPAEGQKATAEEIATFRAALIRRKQARGLYQDSIGDVNFIGRTLFRTRLYLPANVPTGAYIVTAYLIRDNDVVSAQTTPLLISKIGIGADAYEFAYDHSAAYGVIAVIIAVMAGWLASVIFRKS